MIPDDVIETVREAADLVGIIGEHVELRRTGADYRGPCPFHGGTHRNFAVIPKKGMFYCFVCHEAGDVFTFFMKKLGMDYPSAVQRVPIRASRCSAPWRPRPTGLRASCGSRPRPTSPGSTSPPAISSSTPCCRSAWATRPAGRRFSMQ